MELILLILKIGWSKMAFPIFCVHAERSKIFQTMVIWSITISMETYKCIARLWYNSLQCKNVRIDNEIDFVVCEGEPKNQKPCWLDNPRLRDSSEAEVYPDDFDFVYSWDLSISFWNVLKCTMTCLSCVITGKKMLDLFRFQDNLCSQIQDKCANDISCILFLLKRQVDIHHVFWSHEQRELAKLVLFRGQRNCLRIKWIMIT